MYFKPTNPNTMMDYTPISADERTSWAASRSDSAGPTT